MRRFRGLQICHSSLCRRSCEVLFCHSGTGRRRVSAQLSGLALLRSEATWLPGDRLCEQKNPCSFACTPCLVFFIWPNVFSPTTFTCTTRSSFGIGTYSYFLLFITHMPGSLLMGSWLTCRLSPTHNFPWHWASMSRHARPRFGALPTRSYAFP